ncbi:MAG: AraC family transcriptional regulator [Opitutaceae bacterium]
MPKIDQHLWHNPFTPQGLKPPAGKGGDSFQIHECGLLQLTASWSFQGVCSPYWRLYYDWTPGAWVESGGRRYALTPEKFILVPDGVVFNCCSRPGAEHMWVHFSLYPSLTEAGVGVVEIPATRTGRAVAAELERRITQRDAVAATHTGAALLHLVFAEMGPGWFAAIPPRLRKLYSFIQHSLGGEISNSLLAAQAGLSVEAFIRWFKTATGRTPAAFVAERRIREACRRLAFSADSIEQIAEAVGFANRHHFSRVFKQHAGCGPAQFRRGRAQG